MSELIVSSSPHSKDHRNVSAIMGYVLIALSPAAVGSVLYFKLQALLLILISILSCVLFEFLYNMICKRKQTIYDCSAIVTGVLLAFNLPSTAPLWLPPIGALFAIVVVKMLFGGLGRNVFNPAIAGRILLFISFPQFMTGCWVAPFDSVSAATPLAYLKNSSGELVTITSKFTVGDCLLGNVGGCLGETSAALLLLGGIFLLYKKVITWHIPVSFIGTVAIVTLLLPRYNDISAIQYMLYHIFSGGLFLGAFFMATDYATSPITPVGRIIYGIGCGLITVFIRYFGGYPEGVSFAILLMNCFANYLDKKTIPVQFGGERRVIWKTKSKD
ncbi:MAG: RnfABCDGE type electron transport complex subunit D [Clostridia bacterium]|nr:RnfABCDGE type electron transport complex subunit D [Clostridia bacterium]